jgi:RNA polymerase-binding transcription factor DksA
VIEERRFERVGGTRTLEVDVRFVASRTSSSPRRCAPGRFREDLFHRLNVVPLRLEPLRARRDDVLPLALAFLARERERGATAATGLAQETVELLRGYQWPGNVRELRSLIERAATLVPKGEIEPRALPAAGAGAAVRALGRPRAAARRCRDVEVAYIRFVLEATAGSQTRAAPCSASPGRRSGRKGAATGSVRRKTDHGPEEGEDYREKLLTKKQEILEAYNKNKSYGKRPDGEATQDIADKAANSYTKEFLFSLSNTERDLLQQVDEAIVRIETRRFGVCAACEDDMNLKRLEAVPWARPVPLVPGEAGVGAALSPP